MLIFCSMAVGSFTTGCLAVQLTVCTTCLVVKVSGTVMKRSYCMIGSNNLTRRNCTAEIFAASVVNFVRFLLRHGVRRVIFMEILFRVHDNRFPLRDFIIHDYNRLVAAANSLVKLLSHTTPGLSYWSHGRRLHGPNVICSDGVHLNGRGLVRYRRSVHNALIHVIRC